MYDIITPQNLDYYFTFKHIPGCGKPFRPMNPIPNTDDFDIAKKVIAELILKEVVALAGDKKEVHILLSGGLDSCITLLGLYERGVRKIISHTLNYTGTWGGKNTDLKYARELSSIYSTEHHEHIVTYMEMFNDLDEIFKRLEIPFAGLMSPWFAAKMLPKDVPVFTGDLSDELFGSYKGPRETMGHKGEWLDWRLSLPGWCVFSPAEKKELYSRSFLEKVDVNMSREIAKRWCAPYETDAINAALHFDWMSVGPDQVFYSPSKLMENPDLSPFMSTKLIDYVTALPGEHKIKDGVCKHILKEAFRGLIPDFVIRREKEGFVQPSNYWLRHDWKLVVKATFSKCSSIFNKDYVEKLFNDFYAGDDELVYKIWTIYCYERWRRVHNIS